MGGVWCFVRAVCVGVCSTKMTITLRRDQPSIRKLQQGQLEIEHAVRALLSAARTRGIPSSVVSDAVQGMSVPLLDRLCLIAKEAYPGMYVCVFV